MKKQTILVLALICALGFIVYSSLQNDTVPVTDNEQRDLIPMVMVDGVLYLDTGNELL